MKTIAKVLIATVVGIILFVWAFIKLKNKKPEKEEQEPIPRYERPYEETERWVHFGPTSKIKVGGGYIMFNNKLNFQNAKEYIDKFDPKNKVPKEKKEVVKIVNEMKNPALFIKPYGENKYKKVTSYEEHELHGELLITENDYITSFCKYIDEKCRYIKYFIKNKEERFEMPNKNKMFTFDTANKTFENIVDELSNNTKISKTNLEIVPFSNWYTKIDNIDVLNEEKQAFENFYPDENMALFFVIDKTLTKR